MRRLLGVLSFVCAAFPASGWAFDWTPDTTRYLSDPSFLPLQGQIASATTYTYSDFTTDWRSISGAKTQREHMSSNSSTENLFYGLTDRWRLGVSGSFTESKDKEFYYGRYPSRESSSHDFSNPTFNGTYRVIEQGTSLVNVDAEVFYTPNVVKNSSQVEGGEVYVSRELKSLTVQGVTGFDHYDSFNGKDETITSRWRYYVGLSSQLRLGTRWAINSGVTVSKYGSETINNSGKVYTDKIDADIAPSIALQYHVIPNQAVVGLQYDHGFGGDIDRSGYYNGTWTNRSTDSYALHLRLLF